MKKLAVALIYWVLLMQIAPAQPGPPSQFALPRSTPRPIRPGGQTEQEGETFDLDFPGGGPKALVAAIEKATGKSLNAIVPTDYENIQLPPIKVTGVTVAALFEALNGASQNILAHADGWTIGRYGFTTPSPGTNAVWYFYCNRQQEAQTQKYCRFYQLADYLKDYKVEDITTAIQTGWQLLGVKTPPELKYHAETKLLIAVGPRDDLAVIESVLQELRKATKPPESPGK